MDDSFELDEEADLLEAALHTEQLLCGPCVAGQLPGMSPSGLPTTKRRSFDLHLDSQEGEANASHCGEPVVAQTSAPGLQPRLGVSTVGLSATVKPSGRPAQDFPPDFGAKSAPVPPTARASAVAQMKKFVFRSDKSLPPDPERANSDCHGRELNRMDLKNCLRGRAEQTPGSGSDVINNNNNKWIYADTADATMKVCLADVAVDHVTSVPGASGARVGGGHVTSAPSLTPGVTSVAGRGEEELPAAIPSVDPDSWDSDLDLSLEDPGLWRPGDVEAAGLVAPGLAVPGLQSSKQNYSESNQQGAPSLCKTPSPGDRHNVGRAKTVALIVGSAQCNRAAVSPSGGDAVGSSIGRQSREPLALRPTTVTSTRSESVRPSEKEGSKLPELSGTCLNSLRTPAGLPRMPKSLSCNKTNVMNNARDQPSPPNSDLRVTTAPVGSLVKSGPPKPISVIGRNPVLTGPLTPLSSRQVTRSVSMVTPEPAFRPVAGSVTMATPTSSMRSVTPSSSSSSSGKRKRKFPGPAGVLPKLRPNLSMEDMNKFKPASPRPIPLSQRLNADLGCSQTTDDPFSEGLWQSMLRELEPPARRATQQLNLATVLTWASKKQLPRGKVPVVCVLIDSLSIQNAEASVVLRDPSGVMKGTVHRQVVKEFPEELAVGTIMVLRQVGVFSPSCRSHYLNVTPSNLVRLYPRPGAGAEVRRLGAFTAEDYRVPRPVPSPRPPPPGGEPADQAGPSEAGRGGSPLWSATNAPTHRVSSPRPAWGSPQGGARGLPVTPSRGPTPGVSPHGRPAGPRGGGPSPRTPAPGGWGSPGVGSAAPRMNNPVFKTPGKYSALPLRQQMAPPPRTPQQPAMGHNSSRHANSHTPSPRTPQPQPRTPQGPNRSPRMAAAPASRPPVTPPTLQLTPRSSPQGTPPQGSRPGSATKAWTTSVLPSPATAPALTTTPQHVDDGAWSDDNLDELLSGFDSEMLTDF